jgi:hypothetical protein
MRPLTIWGIVLLLCGAAAAQCVTYLPDPATFPFPLAFSTSVTDTFTSPSGTVNVVTSSVSSTVQFLSPTAQARAVVGANPSSLFQNCGSGFPSQTGTVTSIDTSTPQQWKVTVTMTTGGGSMSITEDVVNTVINADGGCPTNCSLDNIHTTQSYQYAIATGAYTISIQGSRHFLGVDPNTGIQMEQVTQSQGTSSGFWPILGQGSTGTILGVTLNAGAGVVRINPANGNVQPVGPGITSSGFNAGAYDPQGHQYFAVVGPTVAGTNVSFNVVTVDTLKGQVKATIPISDTGVTVYGYAGLQYEPGTGMLLGLSGGPLVRINPLTGVVQSVGPALPCCAATIDAATLDSQHNKYYYVIAAAEANNLVYRLVTVDTVTGGVIGAPPIISTDGFAIGGLQFEPSTGKILGVLVGNAGAGVVRIDPSSGIVQGVGVGPGGCCGFPGLTTGTFDSSHNLYFVVVPAISGGSTLSTVDTLTGDVIATYPIKDATITAFGVGGLQFDSGGCQVTPPVQRLGQCTGKPGPWGGDIYGYHCSDKSSICSLGCALTSLSADLQWAGVSTIPDFTSVAACSNTTPWINSGSQDPHYLNLLMTRHTFLGDYAGLGDVQPDVTARDVSALTGKSLYFSNQYQGVHDEDTLEQAVCHGGKGDTPQPVLVGVTSQCSGGYPGHYVLVTGEVNDPVMGRRFTIADPVGTGTCKNGVAVNTCEFLDCYDIYATSLLYGEYFRAWGSVTDPPGDLSGLDLNVGDSANMLLTDSSGERTGVNSTTPSILKEIPHSSYFNGSIDNDETGESGPTFHTIQIFQPPQGAYTLVVMGLKADQYQVSIRAYSQDGSAQPPLDILGIAAASSTSTFRVTFTSAAGTSSEVVRVATFKTTLADVANSLQLGLIDNAGVANGLSSKLRAAASALAQHESDDAREVLNAFKNQVTAQSGKHITGVAPQVLLEDADSLLSELPKGSE